MTKILLFFLLILPLQAKEVPTLTGPVVDNAGIIGNEAKSVIARALKKYKIKTGTQIQVLTIKSLEGESIEGFSIKVVDKWKLGSEKEDNGILFLIATKDRQIRIEVGQGLEGVLPDALAGRIIDQVKIDLKKGDYEKGILKGISLIINVLGGNTKALAPKKRSLDADSVWPILMLIFWIWITFRRPLWLIPLLAGGRSRGGFGGGGGFSSGSGWSGGGGGFSGGGASGSW